MSTFTCRDLVVFAVAVLVAATAGADTLQIVNTLPGEFTDISSTGTVLHLGDEGEAAITTTIGNLAFAAGRVVVANNGGLGFDPVDDNLAPVNDPIPSNNAFGGSQSTLALWDDVGNDSGTVLWQELNGELIVQWHNVHFGTRQDTARFEIKIFADPGTNPPIYAQFIYADIEQPRPGGGASATIGYQDGAAGFNDVQWSYNTPGAVSNGTVLSLIPEPGGMLLALAALPLLRRRR